MSAGVAAHESTVSADRLISVTGQAEASHEPNRVTIRFGVETRRPTSRDALAANADLMDKVIDAVRGEGIAEDEISTSRFNIHAVYDSRPDRETGGRIQVLAGYQVSNVVQVETGLLDRVGPLIDAGVAAGVNRVEGVQFGLSRDVRTALKNQLIEAAVLDARAKAERALAPLAYRIMGVKNVSLAEFAVPIARAADAVRLEMAHSAPTQIFASEQDISVTVQVTFLIESLPAGNPN